MKRFAIPLIVVLLAGLAVEMSHPAPAAADTVSVSFFHSSLTPYGRWTTQAQFGDVWRPMHVASSWRPYSNGSWVYTNAGWAFDSYEPWAWATYHYGRWAYDPILGWVWVPGTEWAPAWVDFQFGDGWIGWAPLPPSFVVGASFHAGIEPSRYCFVDQSRFLDPFVGRYAFSSRRNAELLRSARDVTRFSRASGRLVVSGPPVDRIERAAHRTVTRRPVVEVTNTRQASLRRPGSFVAVRPPVVTRHTRPVARRAPTLVHYTPPVARRTPVVARHAPVVVHHAPAVVRHTPVVVRHTPVVVRHATVMRPAVHSARTVAAPSVRAHAQGSASAVHSRAQGSASAGRSHAQGSHAKPKDKRPPSN